MAIAPRIVMPTKPLATYPFFDKIQFWVHEPIDKNTIAQLRKQCGKEAFPRPGTCPVQFLLSTAHRIKAAYPKCVGLAGRPERRMDKSRRNRAGLMFNCQVDREEAWEFLHRHLVRRWHRQESRKSASIGAPAMTQAARLPTSLRSMRKRTRA